MDFSPARTRVGTLGRLIAISLLAMAMFLARSGSDRADAFGPLAGVEARVSVWTSFETAIRPDVSDGVDSARIVAAAKPGRRFTRAPDPGLVATLDSSLCLHDGELLAYRSNAGRDNFGKPGANSTYCYDSEPSRTTSHEGVATNTGTAAVDEASLAANTSAKVRGHVFVDKHNLHPLVSKLGSEQAVIKEMLSGVQGSLPKSGFFEIPVQIGGQTVVVRGAVVNGVTRISTAFTP